MGPDAYNCWGLARAVRHEVYGLPLLPEYGRHVQASPHAQRDYQIQAGEMEECAPEPGSIAAVFRGPLCIHVGVVIEVEGRLAVLETNQRSGCRWLRVPDFERRWLRVIYYRDKPNAD
ncbi:MAG: hypothetical protein A2002_09450 [Pseudomonadales bacterium GWC1_66_9]|nr:MAG: hypothetical protein A2002_09450 [Pseudomonadales bacterium GWC1_66_9]